MVIIGKKAGQLANRIILFSHFIVNAIEYKYKLYNPTFDEYCQYFSFSGLNELKGQVRLDGWLKIPALIASRVSKTLFHVTYADQGPNDFDLNNTAYLKDAQTRLVIARGWKFRDFRNFQKHSSLLKKLFMPKEVFVNNIDALINREKDARRVLVGVHVRRGDYSTWQGGKFFFNDSIYIEKMRQMGDQLRRNGKEAQFFLCSNEKIHNDAFAGLDWFCGTGHFIEDLYALAKCDYIIGPPSTYSIWASFYGDVPLLHIVSDTQNIDMANFAVAKG